MHLESERLILRRVEEKDRPVMRHLDIDPAVLHYIGPPKTQEASDERMLAIASRYAEGEGYGIFMAEEKESGQAIGWFVLSYMDNTELIEIGYRLKEEFWGKGYATEMSHVLLDYGLNTLGLEKIVGVTNSENIASQVILKKIGLKHLGQRFHYNQDVEYFEIEKT